MKNKLTIFSVFIIFAVSASYAFSVEIIKLKDIKDGMKGVGYTVVNGTNVEPFDVEVISILKKTWYGSDAILIRLSGLNLEHSGTVAGMSGSPIYFDGKLAGALAFGWQFSKDPIAGVTPIEEMYKLYSETNTVPLGGVSKNSLTTPLVFSGFNNIAFDEYKDIYNKDGFFPLQAGGAISDLSQNTNFLFGDAAAIVLVDGDLSIAGIGTVSHTDNEKFLLFGHSMFSKGRLTAPVSRAYINTVLASTLSSFKIGNAYSNYLGYTVYDGAFGVSGVYGEVPENIMIPISLNIEDKYTTINKTVNFRVLNDPSYFETFLGQAVLSAITSAIGNDEEGTFSISYEIETDYFDKPYKIDDRLISYSSQNAYRELVSYMLSPVSFFTYNTFARVGIKSIKISIKRDKLEYAFLNDITLLETKAKAGETIHLRVGIREYGKDKKYVTIPIKLPSYLANGNYSLFAGNEQVFNYAEQVFMPSKYTIRSLDDVMRVFNKSYSDKKLKVWLYSSSRGVDIDGKSYPNLPPSYYTLLAKEGKSDKSAVLTAVDGEYNLDSSVLGMLNLNIYIEGNMKYENR